VTKIPEPLRLALEQAEDKGLWFIPQYASEDYVQRALRKLHDEVEKYFKDTK